MLIESDGSHGAEGERYLALSTLIRLAIKLQYPIVRTVGPKRIIAVVQAQVTKGVLAVQTVMQTVTDAEEEPKTMLLHQITDFAMDPDLVDIDGLRTAMIRKAQATLKRAQHFAPGVHWSEQIQVRRQRILADPPSYAWLGDSGERYGQEAPLPSPVISGHHAIALSRHAQ